MEVLVFYYGKEFHIFVIREWLQVVVCSRLAPLRVRLRDRYQNPGWCYTDTLLVIMMVATSFGDRTKLLFGKLNRYGASALLHCRVNIGK